MANNTDAPSLFTYFNVNKKRKPEEDNAEDVSKRIKLEEEEKKETKEEKKEENKESEKEKWIPTQYPDLDYHTETKQIRRHSTNHIMKGSIRLDDGWKILATQLSRLTELDLEMKRNPKEQWKETSYPNIWCSSEGRVVNKATGRFLQNSHHHYPMVYLPQRKYVFIHRLVCLAFHCPAPHSGMTVNHKNRQVKDARAENLEWMTLSQQMKHVYHPGKIPSPVFGIIGQSTTTNETKRFTCLKDAAKSLHVCKVTFLKYMRLGKELKGYKYKRENDPEPCVPMMGEEWKTIPYEWNHLGYELSSFGRIRQKETPSLLSRTQIDTRGYKTFTTGRHFVQVHRLVAEVFVPNPNPTLYNVVDHKDENRLNNQASNLRWVTRSQNNVFSHGIPVTRTDADGTNPVHYESIQDATRKMNIHKRKVRAAIKNHTLLLGYLWSWDRTKADQKKVPKTSPAVTS